jgi:myo-inositol 2-dehydrogenase/D-chiro-inositol 1-dehydrogenase
MSKRVPTCSSRSSRRDFLATSARLTATAAVADLAISRSAYAAGSDVVKFGLIGCGGRGSGAAGNAMDADPGAKLVAMADLFEDKVLASRERLKKLKPDQVAVDDAHCFHGFDAYQKVIASDVDVVLIACTSKFHPTYLQAAIAAGKSAFLEKPHALDVPGLKVVAAACAEAEKKKLSVVSGLCWRYHNCVQATMQRVRDGAIGDVVAVQVTYLRSPYRLIERQPEQKELEYQFRNWYHFNWLSGDDLLQSLVHSLDKGAWALGDEPPVRAFGVGGRASSCDRPFIYGDVFDHSSVIWEYANGVRMYGMGRAQNGCFNDVSSVIMGTKGIANVEKGKISGPNQWEFEGPKCNMTQEEQRVLFTAVRERKPVNNAKYMFNSTMIGIMGRMACFTGREITWEDAIKSTHVIGPAECTWDMDPPVKPDDKGVYPVAIPGITKLA